MCNVFIWNVPGRDGQSICVQDVHDIVSRRKLSQRCLQRLNITILRRVWRGDVSKRDWRTDGVQGLCFIVWCGFIFGRNLQRNYNAGLCCVSKRVLPGRERGTDRLQGVSDVVQCWIVHRWFLYIRHLTDVLSVWAGHVRGCGQQQHCLQDLHKTMWCWFVSERTVHSVDHTSVHDVRVGNGHVPRHHWVSDGL